MRKILYRIVLCFMMAGLLWPVSEADVLAAQTYRVVLEDSANLLTDEQEEELRVTMEGSAQYGNVVFRTIAVNSRTAEQYARDYYNSRFGEQSGVIFLIDMDNRKLWIHSYGNAEQMISKDYAEIITDNVYLYATKGDYFVCANKAFVQIQTKLAGGQISRPMTYICNALFAISLALLCNFFLMRSISSVKAPKKRERSKGIRQRFHFTNPQAVLQETKRIYSPVESSSSGSSSGGSSSGSSGGSSSSGSGGGHSF